MEEITHCPTINKTSDRRRINKKRGRTSKKTLLDHWSCDICPQRGNCRELCPPMDWLLKQLEVEPGAEQPVNSPDHEHTNNIQWPQPPTTTEIIFTMFFFDRLPQQEIAKKLYISQQYVSKAIKYQKQILLNNLQKKVVSGCKI